MGSGKLDKSAYKYIPVYPVAPMDMKYHYYDEKGILKIRPGLFKLAQTVDDLREYLADCEGKFLGVDTETTGLTYGKDHIVGFSVSKDRYSGIYVPIRHKHVRRDKIKEDKRDENGNILYTKTGKPRTVTRTVETYFDSEKNLPIKESLDVLYEAMLKAKCNIMHNSEFDLTMIRQEGYDVMKCKTFDTTILTYLFDAENKVWNKLKEASKIVLGRHPMKFYEALGTEKNFATVDLDIATDYAGSDPANTLGLFEELYPKVKDLLKKCPSKTSLDGAPYDPMMRDNELIRAFTDYYSHVNLVVDRKEAENYKAFIEEQLAIVEEKIYKYFQKGKFNLSPSSKEFKTTMEEFHIITGLLTEAKQVSYGKKGIAEMEKQLRGFKEILKGFKYIAYDGEKLNKRASANELRLSKFILTYGKDYFHIKDTINNTYIKSKEKIALDKINFFEELKLLYKRENAKVGILKSIQARSSLCKALNSYVTKLTEVDNCHMRYRLQGTASGRLSSGNGSKNDTKKNHYFIDLNAQNLTKPHSAYYKAIKTNSPNSILGWDFELVTEEYYHQHKDDEIIVEGSDPKNNIRNCLVAPAGRYIASLDYSAQEYRVLAILSKDHKMIDNFLRGLDPHTATAYAIWGEEHYDRQKRKKAKGVNFLMNYCGGARTLADNIDIPLQEAEDIITMYEKAYFECVNWKKNEINKAIKKQDGVAYTIFGRPRQFKSRMSSGAQLKDRKYQVEKYPNVDREILERAGDGMIKAVERRVVSHLIQGCLQGHTRVLTNHGYIPIQKLYEIQENNLLSNYQVYTGTHWADFCVLDRGMAKKARLKLKGGMTLDCDERHELFCHTNSTAVNPEARLKKVTDLNNRKQSVCTMKPTKIEFEYPKSPAVTRNDQEKIWYYIGSFLGSGNWEGNIEQLNYATDELGLTINDKKVPEILFMSSLKYRKSFIKGFTNKQTGLQNTELLNDVAKICSISGEEVSVNKKGQDNRYGARKFDSLAISDELVQTYTLSVFDDEHRFVSDGIISKNCCGDICRWDLIQLYRRYFKNRDPHIDFYSTVHDEINFAIDKDKVIEYVREIDDIMTFTELHPQLPIITSIDLGYTLGVLFPFEWKDETRTELVPLRA